MKRKFNKNNLLWMMIGALICGAINVGAATLINSKNVLYDSSKSGSSASNVSDALDELYGLVDSYENSLVSIIALGSSSTYNIKDLYPNVNYKSLTEDNFIVGTVGDSYSYNKSANASWRCAQTSGGYSASLGTKSYSCSKSMSVTKSYDATTGVLTVTATNCTSFAYFVLNPSSAIDYLGSETSYNIKELYPNIDYTKLTEDHFAVGMTSGKHSYNGSKSVSGYCYPSDGGYDASTTWSYTCSGKIAVEKSYDASTGILTVTASNTTPFVYFLKGLV